MGDLLIEADLHVHTVASPCAFSTLGELLEAARTRGVRAIAVTDHGPALPGGIDRLEFRFPTRLPSYCRGIRVYRGVEANILDQTGRLDLEGADLAGLDLVIAGMHPHTGYSGTCEADHTRAVVAAMKNPAVRIIAHPHSEWFPVDMETVVDAAATTGTWLELNARYLGGPGDSRSRGLARDMLTLAAERGALVCINSDAHFMDDVGKFADPLDFLVSAGFPPDQVVNAHAVRAEALLLAPKPCSDPSREVEERLDFLVREGQVSADVLPAVRRALRVVEQGLGKRLDGEGAVMFVTHLATTAQRFRQGEGGEEELDGIIRAELQSQPSSLFTLVDRLVSLFQGELGIRLPEVERWLLVAHLASLAG